MSFVKKMKEQGFSLARLIHESVTGYDSPRSDDPLHASTLTSINRPFCPREIYIRDTLNLHAPEFLPAALRITFDVGMDIQERVNNEYLRHVMFGHWYCEDCHWYSQHPRLAPTVCPQCGYEHKPGTRNKIRYKEIKVRSVMHNLVGSIDAIISTPQLTENRIVEIKSMDKDKFKSLTEPLPEHTLRTQLYMYLAAHDKAIDFKISKSRAHILYVSKSYGFKNDKATSGIDGETISPFKEFVIGPADEEVLGTYLIKAAVLNYARKHHLIPGGICTKAVEKRAKACSVCSKCFSGQFPSQVTWAENNQITHPQVSKVMTPPELDYL